MKFLLFDTSANGQPANYQASARDTSNWPRMLHISWQLMNEKGQILDQRDDLIKPQGFPLNEKMMERHLLTAADLNDQGIGIKQAVEHFMAAVREADMVFAHNLSLNTGVVTAEADRCDVIERLSSSEAYCLMQETTYYCGIMGKRGKLKWPSLPELHKKIFGKSFNRAGRADADVTALGRCFIVLYKTKVLEDIFDE